MSNNEFGFKELYEVSIKVTYPIEIKGRNFDYGETIAYFDKIQLGIFEEQKVSVAASGGFDNRELVWWDNTKEVRISLTQGVYSKSLFSIMAGAALFEKNQNSINLPITEILETDENGNIFLS